MGTTSVSITVNTRSMIISHSIGRTYSGTVSGYKISFTTSSGNIIVQKTTLTSQDQNYSTISASAIAIVDAGTYTVARSASSTSLDNQSIIAFAIPLPLNVDTP